MLCRIAIAVLNVISHFCIFVGSAAIVFFSKGKVQRQYSPTTYALLLDHGIDTPPGFLQILTGRCTSLVLPQYLSFLFKAP